MPPILPPVDKGKYTTCREKWDVMAIIIIVVLVSLTFLPIGTLVVGQVHKNNCPIQTWIPEWMTIFGAVGLAAFGVLIIIVRL